MRGILFVVLINLLYGRGDYSCNMNVQGLQAVTDHSDDCTVECNGTIIDIILAFIKGSYYLQNGEWFNITIDDYDRVSNKIQLECNSDAHCILQSMQNIRYYSANSEIKGKNYVLFSVSNQLPVSIDSINLINPMVMEYDDIFNIISKNIVIAYIDEDLLDKAKNGGYIEDISLGSGNKYPVIITGIYNDEYEDVYLKYNPMFGSNWGCCGYGYIRVSDYSNVQDLVNNGGVLSTMVLVRTSNMYSSETIYNISGNDILNIIITISILLSLLGIFMTVMVYRCIVWTKNKCNRGNSTNFSIPKKNNPSSAGSDKFDDFHIMTNILSNELEEVQLR
jgi:hypothetical protein